VSPRVTWKKNLDVLTVDEVCRFGDPVDEVWSGEVALTVGALVAAAAFTGMRPAELYGLRWADIDFRNDELHVEGQYSPKSRRFELPNNGRTRIIVLTPQAKQQLLSLPRPVDSESLIFRASRGGPMSGRVQHYYRHPVRCRFGRRWISTGFGTSAPRGSSTNWSYPLRTSPISSDTPTGVPWCNASMDTLPSGSLVSGSSGLSEATTYVSSPCQRQGRGRLSHDGAPRAA